jgi:hypothetical protein
MMSNQVNIIYYLFIVIIIFILLKQSNIKERFNYFDQHNYLNCCRKYGCRNFRCRRFIKNKIGKNRAIKIGYLKYNNHKGKNETYVLYRQKDYSNINKYKYFYRKNNSMNILKTKTNLHSNDPIILNNKRYLVKLFDNNVVNQYFKIPKKNYIKKKVKVPDQIFNKYHYIGELDNIHIPTHYFLYGKLIDKFRGIYRYIILKKVDSKLYVASKMNFINKLKRGDYLNIKLENALYTPFTIV